jgi:hypothetical protein
LTEEQRPEEVDAPLAETPPSYSRVEPHYFGLTPHLLAGSLAAALLLAGIVLVATGTIAVGLVLLVAGLLLATLFAEQARRRRTSALDRATALAADRSLAAAGFARAVVGTWAGAGRRATRVRVEAKQLERRRSRLQYELGGAVHDGDDTRADELRRQMREFDAEIERRNRDARDAIDEARRRTRAERRAVSTTQVRRPSA